MLDYAEFIHRKHLRYESHGFEVDERELNKHLRGFQRSSVGYYLRKGRSASFMGCGLGKTIQQLCFADEILKRNPKEMTILLCPPAVQWQTVKEAEKFGISARVKIVKEQADCEPGINITNYERLHLIDASKFIAVVPDESSVLKNFTGATKRKIIEDFANTPYRLPCTATPAPNDRKELGNHAEMLGIMPSNEMLARWFVNDGSKVGLYRLKKHGERDFWKWMASWAICCNMPSDIGGDDTGYILPPLNVVEHVVNTGLEDGMLFDTGKKTAISATDVHKEKRRFLAERAEMVSALVNDSVESWVVWVDTDYEADAIRKLIPDAIEVRGSQNIDTKERLLRQFSEGQARVIITKAEIAGFGLNWQHCHNTTWFAGYSYERWYQAMARLRRFGQVNQVNCHLFRTRNEESILDTLKAKDAAQVEMHREMAALMKEFMLSELGSVVHAPRKYDALQDIQLPSFLKARL